MRKKLASFSIAAILAPCLVLADAGFTFDYETNVDTVEIGQYRQFDAILTNTGDTEDIYTLTFVGDDYPDDWITSMCIFPLPGCLPPFRRTYDDTLSAGDFDSIAVDITPYSEGVGSVWFRIQSNNDPSQIDSIQFTVHTSTSGVETARPVNTPTDFRLESVYPNPFNGEAKISFVLFTATEISLKAYSVNGREVATLAEGMVSAGRHTANFHPGVKAGAGVYLIRLEAAGQARLVKAVYVK